jgi:hypothetical protein
VSPGDIHETVWPVLASHAMGVLPKRMADRVDAHLYSCLRCRDRLAGYADAVDRLAIAGEDSSPELVDMWEGVRDRVRSRQAEHPTLRLLHGEG